MPAARGKKLKIRESIKDNDAYFTAFINSIPSSVYFNDQAARKISRAQSQKAAEEGQLGPLASTGEVSQKWMNKRAKFNPNTVVTTSEMQALHARLPDDSGDKLELELLSGEQSEESELDGETSDGEVVIQDDTKGVKSRKRSAASEESEESGVVSSESADEKEKEASTKPPIKVAKKVKRMKDAQSLITNGHVEKHEPTLKPKARSEIPNQRLSTEQLREKLRARIESLQAKRFNDLSAEEYMEKKRLRRKESKLKLKERRREAKKLKVSAAKQRKQESAKLNGVAEIEPTKSTDNKNKMVFSKFEFSNERKEKKKEKLNKPKSYKELYEKVSTENRRRRRRWRESFADVCNALPHFFVEKLVGDTLYTLGNCRKEAAFRVEADGC